MVKCILWHLLAFHKVNIDPRTFVAPIHCTLCDSLLYTLSDVSKHCLPLPCWFSVSSLFDALWHQRRHCGAHEPEGCALAAVVRLGHLYQCHAFSDTDYISRAATFAAGSSPDSNFVRAFTDLCGRQLGHVGPTVAGYWCPQHRYRRIRRLS